jgi:hypothetical protein
MSPLCRRLRFERGGQLRVWRFRVNGASGSAVSTWLIFLVPRYAELGEAVLVGRLGGVLGAGIFLSATRLDLLTWKPLGLPFSTCRFTVFVQ